MTDKADRVVLHVFCSQLMQREVSCRVLVSLHALFSAHELRSASSCTCISNLSGENGWNVWKSGLSAALCGILKRRMFGVTHGSPELPRPSEPGFLFLFSETELLISF